MKPRQPYTQLHINIYTTYLQQCQWQRRNARLCIWIRQCLGAVQAGALRCKLATHNVTVQVRQQHANIIFRWNGDEEGTWPGPEQLGARPGQRRWRQRRRSARPGRVTVEAASSVTRRCNRCHAGASQRCHRCHAGVGGASSAGQRCQRWNGAIIGGVSVEVVESVERWSRW